jgi:hypothetical protein
VTHRAISLLGSNYVALGVKRTSTSVGDASGLWVHAIFEHAPRFTGRRIAVPSSGPKDSWCSSGLKLLREQRHVMSWQNSALLACEQNAELLNRINLIPAVQSDFQKYFPSGLPQIKSISLTVSSRRRGVSRSSRTRGGMRWTRQRWARDVIAGRVRP